MSSGSSSDIEKYMSVGLGCVFTPDQSSPAERMQVVVRGWAEGKYLIVEEVGASPRQPLMRKGGTSILRFLVNGVACAATTNIVEWRTGPYTRLAWPKTIDYILVRKQSRVELDLPCEVRLPDGMRVPGHVRDVSSNGCGIVLEVAMKADAEVFLTFTLPDGVRISDASFTVRNTRALSAAQTIAGCVLTDPASPVIHDLEFFVASKASQDRHGDTSNTTVLFIDSAPDVYKHVASLREKGYDASAAVDMVDGFFRLRLSPPAVVLLSAKQKQTNGPEICRFIRGARGLDTIPVYVYGGPANTIGSQASDAGANGHIETLEDDAWFNAIAEHLPEPQNVVSDGTEEASEEKDEAPTEQAEADSDVEAETKAEAAGE